MPSGCTCGGPSKAHGEIPLGFVPAYDAVYPSVPGGDVVAPVSGDVHVVIQFLRRLESMIGTLPGVGLNYAFITVWLSFLRLSTG